MRGANSGRQHGLQDSLYFYVLLKYNHTSTYACQWAMTHAYAWRGDADVCLYSLVCVPWLIRTCAMTHVGIAFIRGKHATFIRCSTRFVEEDSMTHSFMYNNDSFVCVEKKNVTPSYAWGKKTGVIWHSSRFVKRYARRETHGVYFSLIFLQKILAPASAGWCLGIWPLSGWTTGWYVWKIHMK